MELKVETKLNLKIALGILTVCTLIPGALSGCILGKNSSKIELNGYDISSGYYSTAPQTLALTATVDGNTISQNGSLQNIPPDIAALITNPVFMVVKDPIAGIGYLSNATQTTSQPVYLYVDQKTGALGVSYTHGYAYIGCELDEEITYSGNFSQQSETIVNGYKTRGKITLDVEIAYRITGVEQDCAEMLTDMEGCYANAGNCNIASSSFVHSIFDPLIDSNVFAANQIHSVSSVKLTASYR